jgi:Uma2 family endonuclease
MATVAQPIAPPHRPAKTESKIPLLENGDKLSAAEFLRRYEAMPELKKAELIHGTVFKGSPVRFTQHAQPDSLLQTWIGVYAAHTPGVMTAGNVTLCLSPEDIPQPDSVLLIDPKYGGPTKIDAKGYLTGPPELVIEVAASSVSIDAHDKLELYSAAAIPEYLLFRTEGEQVDWRNLGAESYALLTPDAEGIIKSKGFPGLWLNVTALLKSDAAAMLATLQRGLESPEHAAFVKDLSSRAPKA